jgi:lipoprotein-anchoring transpeptidase ErfK/SrfK
MTTTTAAPAANVQPLIVDLPSEPARVTPERGSQLQVTPTDPPPPTTTTTTLPPHLQLPPDSGAGRRVVYHKSRQRVWTVEADGTVSKTHLVSGNLHWEKPRAGTYSVFSRSSYTCNIKNRSICWRYMVRFAHGPSGDNIGFHEIPTNTDSGGKVQSVSQLGTPLSGGCVRQSTPDAQYMWAWAPVGTQVVVIQ